MGDLEANVAGIGILLVSRRISKVVLVLLELDLVQSSPSQESLAELSRGFESGEATVGCLRTHLPDE
jgi:hypothetical protein